MIRLHNIKVPLDYDNQALTRAAARQLGISASKIAGCTLARRSVDARRKSEIGFVVSLDLRLREVSEERRIAARLPEAQGGTVSPWQSPVLPRVSESAPRPIVVGFGPAGIFASLILAEAGARPIVLERGRDVDRRLLDVQAYQTEGSAAFSPISNIQFGEGGAGTFSDGKLNTGTKDPNAEYVLRTLVRFGAPEDILVDAKPHVGTDKLAGTVKAIRRHILSLGGEVRFESRVCGLLRENGRICGVQYEHDGEIVELPAEQVVFAVGHSARDTFQFLYDDKFTLLQKPFSIGARIEHPQPLVDVAQYGIRHPRLGPADYKLSCHLANGRGVYTFCMCPGGEVVAAASEPDSIVTNGMSRYARDGENANSALLVGIGPEDFGSNHPLAGMMLQREIEQRAFDLGGRSGYAPCQLVGDLLAGRPSSKLGSVRPSYRPGVVPTDLALLLPGFVISSMQEAIPLFARRLRGFDLPDAVLTAPETRSSSPVRMPRGENTVSLDCEGLHPCGEGAGYAGGITSAATDGIRCAMAILEQLQEEYV